MTTTTDDNIPSTAAQMDEFTKLFGPEGTEIDFSRPSDGNKSYLLPTPESTDNLDDAIKKLEAIAQVVADGKSAAVFTGELNETHGEWDAEILAIETMDPIQKKQYSHWKKGVSLPVIDWKNNVQAVPPGQEALSRCYKIRAAAVAMAWKVPTASPENASWICHNLPHCKPLVMALCRLQEKERYLKEKMAKVREYELAEGKIIARVSGIVTDTLNERIRQVNKAKEILQAREKALSRKEAERKSTSDPIHQQPLVLGDPRLRPLVKNCEQIAGSGVEKSSDMTGLKQEPLSPETGKRPRSASQPQEDQPAQTPRGPKRPAQMGRRGGLYLNGSRA
ncbi:hypothetical protein MMC07_004069 [Pseudocyphellaria aurata]|nr:hypothetical protein [Pseudocyphellaria aurata]